MPSCEVTGAVLNFETFGQGPLLLIAGADGREAVFHEAAKFFAENFTVVCWDLRGYSQNNAHSLITHLSPGPASVFGSSSGAIVAQRLLAHDLESVTKLIAHEPPALSVLPEDIRVHATGLIQQVHNTYRVNGTAAVMEVLTSGLSEGGDGAMMRFCMDSTRRDEIRANAMFWFEFELRQYTSATVDLPDLAMQKNKYLPAAGMDSADGPRVGPIALIAQKVRVDLIRIPGEHIRLVTAPKAFASSFLKILK